jgi:hypothetical protein
MLDCWLTRHYLTGLSLIGASDRQNSTPIPPLIVEYLKKNFFVSFNSGLYLNPINKMIKLATKAIENLLMQSLPYSRKGLGYTILLGVVWMPSPATPTGSPATLTREEN